MTSRRIRMRAVGGDGALVRLPRLFWLYLAFRTAFPNARGVCRAWSFYVPGVRAMPRLGAFDALHGDAAAREVRERERAREDADWAAWEARAA